MTLENNLRFEGYLKTLVEVKPMNDGTLCATMSVEQPSINNKTGAVEKIVIHGIAYDKNVSKFEGLDVGQHLLIYACLRNKVNKMSGKEYVGYVFYDAKVIIDEP